MWHKKVFVVSLASSGSILSEMKQPRNDVTKEGLPRCYFQAQDLSHSLHGGAPGMQQGSTFWHFLVGGGGFSPLSRDGQ